MLFRSKVNRKSNEGLISGRKHAPRELGHVLVLGLGVSGRAVVRYLAPLLGSRVSSMVVLAGPASEGTLDWVDDVASELGPELGASIEFVFDDEDAAAHVPEGCEMFDLCVASPGISVFSGMYEGACEASARVVSEVELAWGESAADSVWVAITGTNGKTTTTALTAHILGHAGYDVRAVGNIGDACIEAVAADLAAASAAGGGAGSVEGEGEGVAFEAASDACACAKRPCYVAELSSFQLASIDAFAPDVAVMLGIKPDHVEWHRTYEHYVASKMRLLENLPEAQGAVAVLDATNDEVRAKVRAIRNMTYAERGFTYIPLGTARGIESDMREACGSDNAAFVDAGMSLRVAFGGSEHALCGVDALNIKGSHNWTDALAAASAAIALGVDDGAIAKALASFAALPHRIEPLGEVDGIGFYNDSKATNVDSAVRALSAFPGKRVAILLGGHDKMTPLDDLVQACRESARVVVCYGEARERFAREFAPIASDGVLVLEADGLASAFGAALASRDEASGLDVVLLSPACSSFDEFSCFEERGDFFRSLVCDLRDAASQATL